MPGQHRRRMPLIWLLAKLGWQRDPNLWTVPCRDPHGRRTRLLIRLTPSGITLTATSQGPLHLTALEVGWLRTAAQDAIRTCGLLTNPDADADHVELPPPGGSAGEPAGPTDQPSARREVVHIERVTRPTVSDLRARCQAPST